jgi:four helix bundle protein
MADLFLAVRFYKTTRSKRLPSGLKDQLGRAASSVALNLSEGWGKSTTPDRHRFYQIAFGSIRECQAIVDLESQEFTTEEQKLLDQLAAGTYRLINPIPR